MKVKSLTVDSAARALYVSKTMPIDDLRKQEDEGVVIEPQWLLARRLEENRWPFQGLFKRLMIMIYVVVQFGTTAMF
jgi:hypothetical protein